MATTLSPLLLLQQAQIDALNLQASIGPRQDQLNALAVTRASYAQQISDLEGKLGQGNDGPIYVEIAAVESLDATAAATQYQLQSELDAVQPVLAETLAREGSAQAAIAQAQQQAQLADLEAQADALDGQIAAASAAFGQLEDQRRALQARIDALNLVLGN